jgi:Tol biopolymer transport system component
VKSTYRICLVLLILALSGCSIKLEDVYTPPPTETAPSTPEGGAPLPWAALHLTGTLLYMNLVVIDHAARPGIQALDLATGATRIVFQAPPSAWINSFTPAPDGKSLILCYSPPLEENSSSGSQALYTLPLDGSAPPQLFIVPATQDDIYLQPELAPSGEYLYFTRVTYQNSAQSGARIHLYEVYRMRYPDGPQEKVAGQAFWPRPSADGSRLVYISTDPETGKNRIFVAEPDGGGPREAALSGPLAPEIIDAPLFSPDGESILFSAVGRVQTSAPGWLERVMGIEVASAHSLPSEWWSVPVTGGVPRQLTHIGAAGLYGIPLPDGKHIVSYSGFGIFIMNLDGSGLTMMVPDVGGIAGTLSLIP